VSHTDRSHPVLGGLGCGTVLAAFPFVILGLLFLRAPFPPYWREPPLSWLTWALLAAAGVLLVTGLVMGLYGEGGGRRADDPHIPFEDADPLSPTNSDVAWFSRRKHRRGSQPGRPDDKPPASDTGT
jgi:hypothetical protein